MGKINVIDYKVNNEVIKIRSAVKKDKENFIKHYMIANEETDFLMSVPGEFNVTIPKEEDLENDLLLVAEVDERIIGSCRIYGYPKKRMKHIRGIAIAIERRYWGLGIGERLMKECIMWADKNDVTRITLEVDVCNYNAVKLYHKLGFEIEGRLVNNKRLENGDYMSGYTMARITK